MRRLVLLIILVSMLSVTGCFGSSVKLETPVISSPTNVPDTISTTAAPTDTSAPIPTLAVPTDTPALATAVPAPATATTAPTVAVKTGPTLTPVQGTVIYTSAKLGIAFQYEPNQNGQSIGVQEIGDKVYVYPTTMPATNGQWVQVYHKTPAQPLVDAINAQVLKGYSLQDCIAKQVGNPNTGMRAPATFVFAQITLPIGPNDSQETVQAKAGKCPQPYAAIGGLAYFVTDTQHPDRFAFFSIGQYGILAGDNETWQATLQFADANPTGSTGGTSGYVDDRSTPQSVIQSYVNAINRQEYSRAYTYWIPSTQNLPPFDQFVQGYSNTGPVQLTLGVAKSGGAAGSIYTQVPVVMIAQLKSGGTQTFAGCYTVRQAQPANFGAPPFSPMHIDSAQVNQVANGGNPAALVATACNDATYQQMPPNPTPVPFNPNDISAGRFLDDRSDPVQVLRSLFNAVNRKEYVRAYYYWESNAPQLQPFDQFQQGYADTAAVKLVTGTPITSAGAGNVYYSVPVTLVATTTNGGTQTFVGCYNLHLANPGIQATPPFQPLAIQSAKVQQVANNANTTVLMAQACH